MTQLFSKTATDTAEGTELGHRRLATEPWPPTVCGCIPRHAIDEKVLPRLTAEDLKELGVAALGDRRMPQCVLIPTRTLPSNNRPAGGAAAAYYAAQARQREEREAAEAQKRGNGPGQQGGPQRISEVGR
jgi:SAM (Sterile alpha motif) domain-containing protein